MEIWSNFASLERGVCYFSFPDVPTSSADKAVRRGKVSYVLGGYLFQQGHEECATQNHFFPAKIFLKVCTNTLKLCVSVEPTYSC